MIIQSWVRITHWYVPECLMSAVRSSTAHENRNQMQTVMNIQLRVSAVPVLHSTRHKL